MIEFKKKKENISKWKFNQRMLDLRLLEQTKLIHKSTKYVYNKKGEPELVGVTRTTAPKQIRKPHLLHNNGKRRRIEKLRERSKGMR